MGYRRVMLAYQAVVMSGERVFVTCDDSSSHAWPGCMTLRAGPSFAPPSFRI